MNFRITKENRINRTVKINSILDSVIKAWGIEKQFAIETLRKTWPQIAGNLAKVSLPEKIEHGMVFITVKHPTIANEIIMLKHTIITQCEKILGEKIKDVRMITRRTI